MHVSGKFISRDGAVWLARQAHNLEVGSSNLSPATSVSSGGSHRGSPRMKRKTCAAGDNRQERG